MTADSAARLIWFDLDDPGWTPDRLEPWLVDTERQRCERLVFAHHRQRQKVACALLRRLISEILERPPDSLRWDKAPHGKPYLADRSCAFNLSHSENFAALVVAASGEWGLDLEDRRRRVEFLSLGKRFFAPPESRLLQQAQDPRQLFFEIWTAKEAYIKALGDGLTHPLDQFLTVHEGQWGLFDVAGRALPWHLSRPPCPFPEVTVALASSLPIPVDSYLLGPEGHWHPWP